VVREPRVVAELDRVLPLERVGHLGPRLALPVDQLQPDRPEDLLLHLGFALAFEPGDERPFGPVVWKRSL
jgi:hypothetical protein